MTFVFSDGGQMGWPMEGGAPPNARGPNGLSVVATVWGMTPGTQIPTTQHAGAYDSMPMYQRGAGGQHPAAGYPPQQQPGFYRQNSMPAAPGWVSHQCLVKLVLILLLPFLGNKVL